MGVPITFLDKYNPEQFEIVGATESEGKGFSNGLWRASSGVAQPVVGRERKYKRLFIKRKINGIMGVPITFLDKYNPEQFEIVGITLGNTVDYAMTTVYKNAVQHNQDGSEQGGGKVNTRAAILVADKPSGKVYYTADNADGYLLSIYPRILIRRRIDNQPNRFK